MIGNWRSEGNIIIPNGRIYEQLIKPAFSWPRACMPGRVYQNPPPPIKIAMPRKTIKGRLKCQVVDSRTKKVIRDYPWERNLITNIGMDEIATRSLARCMLACVSGEGTDDTSTDSGTTTASQSTTTVTASAAIFSSGMIGDTIKWDTGEEARITSFTSTTEVEVANSASVTAAEFTIWHTSQDQLQTEHARSTTYLTGSGNTGSSLSGSVFTHRVTYDFAAEAGSVTINEVGLSWSASVAANMFTRRKLATGIALTSGQQLRVVYDIAVTLSPTTSTPLTPSVTGWPVAPASTVDGDHIMTAVMMEAWNTSGVFATSGSLSGINGTATSSCNDVSRSGTNAQIFLASDSTALPAFNASTSSRTGAIIDGNSVLQTYTSLSFLRDKRLTLTTSDANSTSIRCIGIGDGFSGFNPYDGNQYGWLFVFDQDQTKQNTNTLEINLTYAWDRALS